MHIASKYLERKLFGKRRVKHGKINRHTSVTMQSNSAQYTAEKGLNILDSIFNLTLPQIFRFAVFSVPVS